MDVRLEIIGDRVVSRVSGRQIAAIPLADFVDAVTARADSGVLPGIIPEGVRFVRRRGRVVLLVIEEPPQVRTVRWLADQSPQRFGPGAAYQTATLAFPFIVLVLVFSDGELTKWQQCFYRSAALRHPDDPLSVAILHNVARNGSLASWLCLARHEVGVQGLAWDDKVREIRRTFWGAAFNGSCSASHWDTMRNLDDRLASVEAWEQASQRDPLFPIGVAWRPTGQTIGQVMDYMLGLAAPAAALRTASDVAALLSLVASDRLMPATPRAWLIGPRRRT